jgi:hypothetical protein
MLVPMVPMKGISPWSKVWLARVRVCMKKEGTNVVGCGASGLFSSILNTLMECERKERGKRERESSAQVQGRTRESAVSERETMYAYLYDLRVFWPARPPPPLTFKFRCRQCINLWRSPRCSIIVQRKTTTDS